MKKLILAAVAAFSINIASADQVLLATDSADVKYYGAAETFQVLPDGYSVMITRDFGNGNNQRYYAAVYRKHCQLGYGDLLVRFSLQDKWNKESSFIVGSSKTVGDMMGSAICGAGKEIEKDSPKKKSVKPASYIES